MANADTYLSAIDSARLQRVKELSEVKRMFRTVSAVDPRVIASKSVVVLAYANWEGFYNQCVGYYLDFLCDLNIKVADASWLMLVGALSGDFDALRAKNHSLNGRREFITQLKSKMDCRFDLFDRSVVMARSNLDFSRLRASLALLNLSELPFNPIRIRLDKELVGWRHGVAHGDSPDLSDVNVSEHIDFTDELMLLVSGTFQSAVVAKNID